MDEKIDEYTNSLIYGECVGIMQRLPSESIDFVLTDPPYIVRYTSRDGRKIENDDNDRWLKPAFQEAYRLLKPDRYAVSFYGWNSVDLFMSAWKKAGFKPVAHIVWYKPYASKIGHTRAHHESAYLLAKGDPQKPLERLCDVLPWKYSGNIYHPTQKPVSVLTPPIESFCPKGGIVLDPFSGSASTAIAAKKCDRRYICIEKDKTYFDIGCRRLNETS